MLTPTWAPRSSASATAAGSTLHLAPLPGTDLALANGLLHLAVKQGRIDADYVARRTTGFAAVRAGVAAYWPDRVERITGVGVAQLLQTLDALTAESAMILTARGAEQHSHGTATAQAWINLALALGKAGRPFCGWGTLTGQGNGQGGREHGQKADQLPGYRRIADPAHRAAVAAVPSGAHRVALCEQHTLDCGNSALRVHLHPRSALAETWVNGPGVGSARGGCARLAPAVPTTFGE